MKSKSERYGEWALVAGAAEGIGASFCEALARRKMNLLMIDIREKSLEETGNRIEQQYHVKTLGLVQDLAEENAWINCLRFIEQHDCRLLIYVPAYSPVKPFLSNSTDELDRYIRLNSLTPLKLVHGFVARTRAVGSGGIVLMSSLAGLVGPKFVAPYAATKAFNIVLAESLFHEFRSHAIDIIACCAGPTSTPSYWSSFTMDKKRGVNVMEPSRVAECAMKNLGKKPICIPGLKNLLFYFILLHVIPRKIAGNFVSKAIGKMYSLPADS